jgi:ABC-2 type transport system ATP-binding protein
LELLGLEELMPRRISDLSGGMAQRVSVGLALLSRPRLLLMDEATTGLDRDYVPRLLDWLEDFVAGGGGLVWCSHHAGELDRLCGAVLTLENGALRT